jgi:hypothetical protein
MQKIKFFLIFCIVSITPSSNSYSFSVHKAAIKPERSEVLKNLTVRDFIRLSAKQFRELTGKKLNHFHLVL